MSHPESQSRQDFVATDLEAAVVLLPTNDHPPWSIILNVFSEPDIEAWPSAMVSDHEVDQYLIE
jgi:hypothetical protein